ncbi:MAG: DUF763 domain-containing protein [Candidatus Bathyarchaeota archaeon]|nr:MAG: DUF763 domain-containing protein [Candidatus Bathyarchaeota archaeon]
MKRTGVARLPLHYGRAPRWLVVRMIRLAREIVTVIVDEYGQDEFLQRISDPFWFQALGCALGYDWHSSGVTTVLTGVLKSATSPNEQGLAVCGGKGRASRQAQMEINHAGEKFGFTTDKIERLRYASRMSAKIDNTAIQAGYPLYHHAFFITEGGKWAVVQQGMSVRDRTARRYHWCSSLKAKESLIIEPHDAIVGDVKRKIVLNMTAKESEDCQKTSTDIAKEEPRKVMRMLKSIRPSHQKSLQEWMPKASWQEYAIDVLSLPRNLNWKAVKRAYEFQPKNYEELLGIRGMGPATVRALALISELIYGEKPSWKDPVKYSFCVGGKDGVPFPVNKNTYDKTIEILENAVKQARMRSKERINAIKRLAFFSNKDESSNLTDYKISKSA